MKSNYKKIGAFVRQVTNRNTDLNVTNLKGININKEFMPSVANINGTDLSKYKVVQKGQFAFNPMHVGRDEMLPIGLWKEEEPIIVSPAYTVFEITDSNILNPEYLMMWCKRSEFDRNCWFTTDNSVRGGFSWQEFCEIKLLLPSFEEQKKIVDQFTKLKNSLDISNKNLKTIDQLGLAIYKQWFEDFEFPITRELAKDLHDPELEGTSYKSSNCEFTYSENLDKEIPVVFKDISIKEFCSDMKNGATPKREILEYWNPPEINWLKTGEIYNNIIFNSEEKISALGFKKSSTRLLPSNTVLMAMYGATAAQLAILKVESTTNQACCAMICKNTQDSAYLYYRLLSEQSEIKRQAIGGAQENLSKALIEKLPIFSSNSINQITDTFEKLINYKAELTKKIMMLEEASKLLLSKISVSK